MWQAPKDAKHDAGAVLWEDVDDPHIKEEIYTGHNSPKDPNTYQTRHSDQPWHDAQREENPRFTLGVKKLTIKKSQFKINLSKDQPPRTDSEDEQRTNDDGED